jgi:hypothetical protein
MRHLGPTQIGCLSYSSIVEIERIKPIRSLNRRSFLSRVAGGAIVSGAAWAVLGKRAEAQVTDRDTGPNSDGPGRGRTGVTDRDPGTDRVGHGRGPRNSRGPRNCSDSDSGNTGDQPGRGRRC